MGGEKQAGWGWGAEKWEEIDRGSSGVVMEHEHLYKRLLSASQKSKKIIERNNKVEW